MAVETLRDIVKYSAENYGKQTAYRYKVNKDLEDKSYDEVNRDSMAVSRMIEAFSLKGKHIAVIGTTSYPWIISYFGITNSASVAVPIDVQLPADAICELLRRADVEMLIYDEIRKDVAEMVKTACPAVKYIVSMQAEEDNNEILSWKKQVESNIGEYETEINPDALCTILFTSGTTGKSKGVMLTHRNLTDNATCLDMKIPVGTVTLCLLPINHVYCLTMDIIKGMYIGTTVCINDSIMRVQKNLKLFQPDRMLVVPLILESIYSKLKAAGNMIPKEIIAKEVFGGNLKTICSGGAYLDPDYVEKFAEYGITILQGYGMTECSPVISTNVPWNNKVGSVGQLIPNCEGKIVNEEILNSDIVKSYNDLMKEIADKRKTLKELYGIEAEVNSMIALINAHKEKEIDLKGKYDLLKAELDAEIAEKKASMQAQIDELVKQKNEELASKRKENDDLKKALAVERKREEEEYDYNLKRKRKQENDAWADEKATREKTLAEREKNVLARENAVVEKEDYIAGLEKKVSEIPTLVDAAKEEGIKKGKADADKSHVFETRAIETKNAYAQKSLQDNIDRLERDLQDARQSNEILQDKLDSAYAQMKELASETVKSTGGVKILDREANGK